MKPKLLTFNSLGFLSVGITGLEPATSRPPDVCATNCAKSRTLASAVLLLRVQRYRLFVKYANFSVSFFAKNKKKCQKSRKTKSYL